MIRLALCLPLVSAVIAIPCATCFSQDPGLPLDPIVQAMIADVSSDTIYANLVELVGFQTRHINSDTVSDLTGIGAARRYIYNELSRYAADPLTVELLPGYFTFETTACGTTGEHRNVVGTIPGTSSPERNFLVMGHMDSRNANNCDNIGYAPGANDDGSGTVVAMEIARVVSRHPLESTLILMTVTGEEQGLLGSEAYADFALGEGMRIDGVLTNDIVGNVEGCADPSCPPGEPHIIDSMSVRHFSGDPSDSPSRQLSRYMRLQAERYVPEFRVDLVPLLDRPGRGGDHIPFYDRGFASVRFTEANENGVGDGSSGRQHNMFDTLSALNTNRGYMANIARVTIAGFASMALAPETPGGLQAFDGGDGESILLTWPLGQGEADFSGYLVAERQPDSLYYDVFHDVGDADQILITGLTEGESVLFCLAAYDSAGNLSIFSEEVEGIPHILPAVPQNVDATSFTQAIGLEWDPNTETDLVRYRVYRSTMRNSGFSVYDSVSVPVTEYTDNGATDYVMYYYQIRAVDADGNESDPSATVQGRLATLDLGILVVDGTADGSGTVLAPTDDQVDTRYLSLLGNFESSHYDLADSSALDIPLSDADLSVFSTVLWHTDVRGSLPVRADTSAIRKYLNRGGNLILSGWKLSGSLKVGASIGLNVYDPGTFVPDFLSVDSTYTSGAILPDFITAIGQGGAYPDISVDSAAIPLYGGALVNTDVVLPPFGDPLVQLLYTHHGIAGSVLEGKPVAWRVAPSNYDIIVFDFPFYYMEEPAASIALRQALSDLGEVTGVGNDIGDVVPEEFRLYPNYPNPFNPATKIRYDLSGFSSVMLTVYDMLGQRVRVLVNEDQAAGSYFARWDGRNSEGMNVSSGIYFYVLRAVSSTAVGNSFSEIRTMVLLK